MKNPIDFLIIVIVIFICAMSFYLLGEKETATPKPNHVTIDSKNNVVIEWYTQSMTPKAKIFILKKGQVQGFEGESTTVSFVTK